MSLILNELKIANKLTLNSSANLGVGKSTTNAPLDVNGNGIISGSFITTGNVGIGTSPSYKLDVAGVGNDNIGVRLTPDYGRVRFNGYDLLGYAGSNLWAISNGSYNQFTLGTSWNWDTSCDFTYTPGTVGAVGGSLIIGQINKNSATFTHGYTALYTNGTEKLRLTRYGTLLVGDSAEVPSAWQNSGIGVFGKNGTDKVLIGYLGSNTNGSVIGSNNSSFSAWSTLNFNASQHIFRIQETEKVKIDASGNVIIAAGGNLGIGTTTPGAKLEVKDGDIWLNAPGGGNPELRFIDDGGIALAGAKIRYGNNDGNLYIEHIYDTTTSGIFFKNRTGGTSLNTLSLVNGNVGIGTTTPSTKLVVALDATDSDVGQLRIVGATSAAKMINVGYHTTGNYGFISSLIAGTGYSNLILQPNGGNVGIGTTTPNKQLTFVTKNDDAIQIRRLTIGEGAPSVGSGISWTWSSAVTDNETWAAIRVIMPGNTNTHMTFSTTPTSGGNAGLAERMRITDSGNVGIATTNPRNRLEISGSMRTGDIYLNSVGGSANPKMFFSSSVGSSSINLEVLQDGTVAFMGKSGSLLDIVDNFQGSLMSVNDVSGFPILEVFSDDRVVAGRYNSNALVVTGSNVGIGTSTPAYKLQVSGAAGDIARFGDIIFNSTTSGGSNGISASTGLGSNGNLTINASGQSNMIWLISSTGNVGIGTATTTYKLTVLGDIYANGGWFRAAGNYGIYFESWGGGWYMSDTDWIRSYGSKNIYHNYGIMRTDGTLQVGGGGSTLNVVTGGDLSFRTNVLYANTSGNVGIGTTSPAYKLDVSGDIRATGTLYGSGAGIGATGTTTSDVIVAKYLRWKNYGDNHVLIDASNGTAPNGTAIDKYTAQNTITNAGAGSSTWGEAISLMGWNGSNTYGVRVDRARTIDSQANSATTTAATANTANTIVLRDGSGNFSAGTITASTLSASTITVTNLNVTTISSSVVYSSGSNTFGNTTANKQQFTGSVQITGSMLVTGNVGIGVSPATKLNILVGDGTSDGTAGIRIGGTNNYQSLELGIVGAYGGMIRSYGNDLNYYSGHWRTIGTIASEDHSHYWYTSKTGSSNWSTAKMALNQDGNLGIGTSSPSHKFHVNNNGGSTSAFYVDVGSVSGATTLFEHTGTNSPVTFRLKKSGYSGAGGTYGLLYLHMNDNTNGNGSALYFTLNDSAGNEREYAGIGAVIRSNTAGGQTGDLILMTSDGGTQRAEKMRIISNGNVGIGTTSPNSTLQIGGTTTGLLTVGTLTNNWGGVVAIGTTDGNGIILSKVNAANDSNRVLTLVRDDSNGATISGYKPAGTSADIGFFIRANASSYFNGGNVGIGTTSPGEKLTVVGNAAISNGIVSNSANDADNMTGGVSMWSSPSATTSLSLFKSWNSIFGRTNTLMTNGYATYYIMDTSGRGWVWRYATGGSAGTNVASLRNDTGQMSLGTSWDWSGGYHAQLNIAAGQGSATTYRDIDLHGSWSGGEGHAITATYSTGANNIVGQIVFQHDSPGSRIKFGRLYHSADRSGYPLELISTGADVANLVLNTGNVGISVSTPLARLHVVSGSGATSVGSLPSGVTGLMDSSGNNYLLFRNTADNNTYAGLLFQDNNVGAYIAFRNYAGSGTNDGTNGDALYYGTYTDHIFQAGSTDTVGARTEIFRIKQSGKTVFYAGVWHNSSDGYERFHFGSGDTTYFKAPNSTFVFRNSSDSAIMTLNTTGLAIGSANPSSRLEVATANDTTTGEPSAWDNKFAVFGTGGSSTAGGVFISYDQTNNRGYIGALAPSVAWKNLILQPNAGAGNVGIGTKTPGYKLEVNGSFAATTKSFVIPHPTKTGKRLVHGVTEGPEHSVFVRGKTKSNKIILPEYWINLVDETTITVQLTSIGKHQNLAVIDVNAVEITIENQNTFNKDINCYYLVHAERKDIEKLQVEV